VNDKANPEDNAFELDGLVVKSEANPADSRDNRAVLKPTHQDDKLFSRITEWHWDRLANSSSVSTVHFFGRLMIESVKEHRRPDAF
jgi:hypothetical protein